MSRWQVLQLFLTYIGYRIGVLGAMNQAANEGIITAGKDVAMQIAAMKPLGVDADSVSEETVAREKAIAIEQIMAEGKAADMAEKIAAGKLQILQREYFIATGFCERQQQNCS